MGYGGGRLKGRRKRGKERLDRYYHLAKEQGFRARSAFKLIQLAQRFPLFQWPRASGGANRNADAAIVDLCAAPGGWLQVCVKHAPVATRILGIDLVPIRGIRGVETLTADIRRPALPAKIKKLLQGADVWLVLHDGSPNMGTDWSIDAFNQNVLVLSALRIAALLLCEGGTFVSKIFRSQDYAAILFVLQTLFTRVHSTKPLASRAVSAEIFVVCQGYKKPDVLDPHLFDPKKVFFTEVADVDAVPPFSDGRGAARAAATAAAQEAGNAQQEPQRAARPLAGEELDIGREDVGEGGLAARKGEKDDYLSSLNLNGGSIFGRGKKGLFAELVRQQARRHRQGDQTKQLRRVTVQEFFDSEEPASLLVLAARDVFFQDPPTPLEEAIRAHALTTTEILRCLKDVQVLGKGELLAALKWRFRVKKALLLKWKAAQAERETQKSLQQQVEHGGGSDRAKGVDRPSNSEEPSTEAESSSDAGLTADEEDGADEKLRRLGALVQRREEKRKKRLGLKEKHKELRLRLSRGTCLDAGESVGHHHDPELFSLSGKAAGLLEATSDSVEDDLFQSDEEKRLKQRRGGGGFWMEHDSHLATEDDEMSESEEEKNSAEARAREAVSYDVDRIACMEAELALSHRLRKLQREQVSAGAKEKKITRRRKARAERVAELQEFRDSLQAEVAAVLAEKVRQGAESDATEEDEEEEHDEEEEEEEEGRRALGGRRSRTNRAKRGALPTGRSPGEIFDDDASTGVVGFSASALERNRKDTWPSGRLTQRRRDFVRATECRDLSDPNRADGGGRGQETGKTAAWFRQPVFNSCEDNVLPAASDAARAAAAEVESDARELLRNSADPLSNGRPDIFGRAKQGKAATSTEAFEPSDEIEAADDRERDGAAAAAEGWLAREGDEAAIVEVDEDALPRVPVCEKKKQQQRRRELARKAEEKAAERRKKVEDPDAPDVDSQQETKIAVLRTRTNGERLEEVPPSDIACSAVKAPADPEEVARIQTLGTLLVNRTTRMDLVDGAYNRYAFNDDQLPEWFVEEEKKHNKPQLPLTKELMRQYRQKLLDISRRPIRKVQEARARKQLRERRRLQKVKMQATAVAESAEFTEAGRARAIEKLARKASKVKEKLQKNYFVVSRGVHGQGTLISNKTAGGKRAKTKFVDRRMKKDKRAKENATNRRGVRRLRNTCGRHRRNKARR